MEQIVKSININADYNNILNNEKIIYPANIMDYQLAYKVSDVYKQNAYNINPYDYTHKQKLSFCGYPKILRPSNEEYDGITNNLIKSLNERVIDVSGTMYNINDIKEKMYPSVRQY